MPATPPNWQASGTIRSSRFITQSDSFTAKESDANERVVGVSMEGTRQAPISDNGVTENLAAIVGESFKAYGDGEFCLIELGDTVDVSAEARCKSDGDGKAVPIATTGTTVQNLGGYALEDGIAGDLVRFQVEIGALRPAIV